MWWERFVKGMIIYQLVNYKKNLPLFREYAHIPYLDLAIVFFDADIQEGRLKRRPILKGALGQEEQETEKLEEMALYDMPRVFPVRFSSIESTIQRLEGKKTKEDAKDGAIPMYVLSNTRWLFGASSLLYPGVLKRISQYLASDLYILPSSIHECIIIPSKSVYTREDLQKIVREMNETQVREDEYLSDTVYQYEESGDILSY